MIRRILAPVLARLGSRTILTVGGTLFLLNMVIPDPLPLVDEFLILAGTVLLSRWAKLGADDASPAPWVRKGRQARRSTSAEAAPSTTDVSRGYWGYSLAIASALAGIGLKIFQWYHSRPLWLDEEMVFLNIRDRMLSQLTGPLWLDQSAPLGWLTLQHVILQAFGTGDRAARALSVLFGLGTVTCAVWVAVRWMRPAGATVFILLCSFGQWMIFYALEAKPYATDAFWALLLPALAVWTTDAGQELSTNLRRSTIWWVTATVGLWISYGAIFVAPACAVVLFAVAWQRGGRRHAMFVAVQGIPWLVSFAAHYYLVMRHARASAYLIEYWSSGMPPAGAGIGGILTWLGHQAAPLASHPGGTTLGLIFWLAIAYGLVVGFRERPTLTVIWLLVPVSACLFATVRLVPLTDRLALWIVPALYGPIAFAADDSFHRGREWLNGRKMSALALAGIVGISLWLLLTDMAQRTQDNLFLDSRDNHGLNDHAALRFLLVQRQPGDVFVTTHLGLPAVWWYGDIPISDPNRGTRHPGDQSPILELKYEGPDSRACRTIRRQTQLQRALGGARRAAVHLGFDSNGPPGFRELILDSFSEFSSLVSFKVVATEDAVAIFDLTSPPDHSAVTATRSLWRRRNVAPLAGCVAASAAKRW